MRLLGNVHYLQSENVLDQATLDLPRQCTPVAYHVHTQLRLGRQPPDERDGDRPQDKGVQKRPWPRHMSDDITTRPMFGQRIFRGVPNQTAWVLHLVHDLVTDIDTGGTADTFVLQALANIDSRRANCDAEVAINAVAQSLGLVIDSLVAGATWLASFDVVGDDQRIGVEHDALKPGVRAHVLADLFAQVAGKAVGKCTVEANPQPFPGAEREGRCLCPQLLDRCEVANEGETGP